MDDLTVWCEVAQAWAFACWCGPHEDCPEHLLNCVVDPVSPAFVNGQTADHDRIGVFPIPLSRGATQRGPREKPPPGNPKTTRRSPTDDD